MSVSTMYPTRPCGFLTSAVTAASASASVAEVTAWTRGRIESVFGSRRLLSAINAAATRSPSPTPVASRIAMWRTLADAPLRVDARIDTAKIAVINAGIASVLMMNQRERTRSRYSRLATTKSLPMAGHPCLDARRADTLEEDLMQRRLHELEPFYASTGFKKPVQQCLRISVRRELDLEVVVVVVHL